MILGKNCKYNILGEIGKDGNKTVLASFTSDRALNEAIENALFTTQFVNQEWLNAYMKTMEADSRHTALFNLSSNPALVTKGVLDSIEKHANDGMIVIKKDNNKIPATNVDPEETDNESILHNPHTIGFSKLATLWTMSDGTQLEPPFNIVDWESNMDEELRTGIRKDPRPGSDATLPSNFCPNGGIADPVLRKAIIEEMKASWEVLRKQGDEIHKSYEDFGNKVKELANAGKLTDEAIDKITLEQSKHSLLDENAWNVNVDNVREFFKQLNKKFPNADYYPEFTFRSREIAPDLKAMLEANPSYKNVDSLLGRIDLLVVDQRGVCHVFDYKVSRKGVGAWDEESNFAAAGSGSWDSNKKHHCTMQQACYGMGLEGWGLKVGTLNIVPMQTTIAYEPSKELKDKLAAAGLVFPSTTPTSPKKVTGVKVDSWITNAKGMKSGKERDVARSWMIAPINTSKAKEEWKSLCTKLFPTLTILDEKTKKKNSVEALRNNPRFFRTLDITSKEYANGKRYLITNGTDLKITVEDDETKIIEALEKLKAKLEVKGIDAAKAIADNITNAKMSYDMAEENAKDVALAKLVSANPGKEDFVKSEFGKYVLEGWTMINNDELIDMGIMMFTNGTDVEVVTLEHGYDDLRGVVKLAKGTSLLGAVESNANVNKLDIPDACRGNIAIIKAAAFIAQNSNLLRGAKISQIRAVNLDMGQSMSMTNKTVQNVYSALKTKIPGAIPRLAPTLFYNDVEALIKIALSKINAYDNSKLNDVINGDAKATVSWIDNVLKQLRDSYKGEFNAIESRDIMSLGALTPMQEGYIHLLEARNMLSGIVAQAEKDHEDLLDGSGIHLSGLLVSSPQFSTSTNIRMLSVIIDRYTGEVRQLVQERGNKFATAIEKFHKSKGYGRTKFDNMFEDRKTLTLKDPRDMDNGLTDEEREFLNTFLEETWKIKHASKRNDAKALDAAKDSEDYYQVPLTQTDGRFREVLNTAKSDGWQGLVTMMKKRWKEDSVLTRGKELFAGDEEGTVYAQYKDNAKLYNKFDQSAYRRAELLANNNFNHFETDLENVFNEVLVAYTKSECADKVLPQIGALRTAMLYRDAHDSTKKEFKMNNVLEKFDKMVKSKILGESIIEGENLKKVARFANGIRGVLTTMTLSLNVTSFLRESVQGIWTGLTRANIELYPGVTAKTYYKALKHFIQESPKNYSNVSLIQQLNAQYGMANQSLGQLAKQRKHNWLNFKNWGSNTLYLGTTAPDIMHRMSIMMAKMMGDGCWEAHSLDEDGRLIYDMNKDKRFEAYVKNDKSDPKYAEQEALYKASLDAFNEEGYVKPDGTKLKYGDKLPRAYTNKEGAGIKNYADYLYGHYDEESKSLLCDTFLGSYALQYKTWVTAKAEQWTMAEGTYETAKLVQKFEDEAKTKPLYVYYGETADGNVFRDIITQDEYASMSDEQKACCDLYFDYEGIPMECLFSGMWDFGRGLMELAKGNPQELKAAFNDPKTSRAIKLGMIDTLAVSLLMLLITFITGELANVDKPLSAQEVGKAIRKMGPAENIAWQMTYAALDDARPWRVWQNFTGAARGEIPTITAATKLWTTSAKVIHGDSTIDYWFTRNFGIARPFNGIAYQHNLDVQNAKKSANM